MARGEWRVANGELLSAASYSPFAISQLA